MGAKKDVIEITPKEWEAIQHGAISNHKLEGILRHADLDVVRELATPQTHLLMSSSKTALAKQKLALGYTRAEVAAQLGVSISTLDRSFKENG
jgi:AraC-like DNA-binding protein